MQVDKFSLFLPAVTALSAFLQQLHWPISSLISDFFYRGNRHQHHKERAAEEPLPGGAEVRPSSRVTCPLHRGCFSHSWAPVPLRPTTAIIPAQIIFCSNKSSLQHSTRSGLGVFGARRIARGAQGQQREEKTSPNTRASARQHPFDKGLGTRASARSKLAVYLLRGRHRVPQQAPSLSAKGRAGHSNTAPAGNSRVPPHCHPTPLSLNPAS